MSLHLSKCHIVGNLNDPTKCGRFTLGLALVCSTWCPLWFVQSRRGKESLLLYFDSLLAGMWLLVFRVSF